MPQITRREAVAIAKKLRAEIHEGTNHQIARVFCRGQWVGQFGIRRGKPGLPHDYVAGQVQLSKQQALDFAACSISYDEYVEILIEKGAIDA